MARELNEVMAGLSTKRRKKVEARAAELIAEVHGLVAVRKIAGLSQAQIAQRLGKKQPSIHKMETQADFYVSTLERFVEAAGGTVNITVNLPGHDPVHLRRFAELHEGEAV